MSFRAAAETKRHTLHSCRFCLYKTPGRQFGLAWLATQCCFHVKPINIFLCSNTVLFISLIGGSCRCVMSDQAHAKRVAAENKRSRRFALGGGFGGGRLKAARPKVGNSRGMVVKAFAADSDEEEESEEVRQAYCCWCC